MEVTEVLKPQAADNNGLIINKAHVRRSHRDCAPFFQPVSALLLNLRGAISMTVTHASRDCSAEDSLFARGQNSPKVWWGTHKKRVFWESCLGEQVFQGFKLFITSIHSFKTYSTISSVPFMSSPEFEFNVLNPLTISTEFPVVSHSGALNFDPRAPCYRT